jgi:hypothetical protein
MEGWMILLGGALLGCAITNTVWMYAYQKQGEAHASVVSEIKASHKRQLNQLVDVSDGVCQTLRERSAR